MGNAQAIIGDPTGAQILEWLKSIPNTGLILLHGFFGSKYLLPTTPESLADVLTHRAYDFEKPSSVRRYVQHFSAGGLAFEEGSKHKQRKKVVMPAFQQLHINQLKPVLSSKSQQLVESLYAIHSATADSLKQKPAIVDITSLVIRMTLDIAAVFALEHDFQFLVGKNEDLFTSYMRIAARNSKLQFIRYSFFPSWLNRIFPSISDARVRLAAASLRDAVSQIVNERYREKIDNNGYLQLGLLNQMVLSEEFTPSDCVDHVLFVLSAA